MNAAVTSEAAAKKLKRKRFMAKSVGQYAHAKDS
jgi:hypothetical protein